MARDELKEDDVLKLQSQVKTSVLELGVDFVLPLSRQEQEEEPPSKSIGESLPLKTKSCYLLFLF